MGTAEDNKKRNKDTTMKENRPKTLEEAVDYYIPKFERSHKSWIDGELRDEDAFSAYCHSMMSGGIGMHIRNEMGPMAKERTILSHS